MGGKIKDIVRRLDTFQREHPWLGFPIGVFKKFSDDKGGYLAALIAYYGFFSLFPLLLVLVTVLGFVVGNNPELQDRIVNSALSQFPVIGNQLKVRSLHGSGIALAVGIAGAVWAGTAVVQALGNAMDRVWDVPARKKPNAIKARVKALMMLGVLGMATLVATALSGIAGASGGALGLPVKALAFVGSLAVNVGVFLVAFKVLTAADVAWRDVRAGALVAAVAWGVLQSVGNYIVSSQLSKASETYGIFAVVIGLLSWLFIGAQLTILAAEVNVVRVRRLWPRSLQPPLTDADKRALELQAKEEERRPEEEVDVSFSDEDEGSGDDAGIPGPGPRQPAFQASGGHEDTRPPGDLPLPDLARRIVEETKTLLGQEVQLAKAEMAGKLKMAGKGAGALGAAGLIGVFAACALVAGLVLGVATVVAGWVAGVAVTVMLAAVGGLAALRGRRAMEQAMPLVPERAMEALASTRQRVTDAWQSGSSEDRTIHLPESGQDVPAPPRQPKAPPRH